MNLTYVNTAADVWSAHVSTKLTDTHITKVDLWCSPKETTALLPWHGPVSTTQNSLQKQLTCPATFSRAAFKLSYFPFNHVTGLEGQNTVVKL